MLRVKGVGYNVERRQWIRRGCFRDWSQLFLFFSNQGLLGNMVEKTLGDIGKAQKNYFLGNKVAKKKIMDAKNINVLIGEN